MAKKSTSTKSKPWASPMPERQFKFMQEILAAPSPIGLEAAMSYGVLKPAFEKFMPKSWGIHQFRGNAGIVVDTHPGEEDRTSVMVIGHADKIRMQVRHISDDGKIWINSDSFLPTTLIGHEVSLFSRDPPQGWAVPHPPGRHGRGARGDPLCTTRDAHGEERHRGENALPGTAAPRGGSQKTG